MKAHLLIKVLIIAVCFASPVVAASKGPQDLDGKLDRRVTDYALRPMNFVEALLCVGSKFQIPMGISWIKSNGEMPEIPFSWKQATVREIIESIVKTQPGYSVDIESSVIRVLPSALIPESENFLKLRISKFEIVNGYPDLALLKLHDLLNPSKHSGFSIGAEPNEPRVTIQLRDSTVADILDALVLGSSRKIWLVVFSSDPNPSPAGFRRTRTLWGAFSPVSDHGEPALNLLHWEDKIPWRMAAR